jgi:hypothetical protein
MRRDDERSAIGDDPMEAIMSALVLWLNIPLMVLAFALMVGVPLWMVLRRPEPNLKENRSVPAYLLAQQRTAPAQQPSQARVYATAAN